MARKKKKDKNVEVAQEESGGSIYLRGFIEQKIAMKIA